MLKRLDEFYEERQDMVAKIQQLNKATDETDRVIGGLKRENKKLLKNHNKTNEEVKLNVSNRLNI